MVSASRGRVPVRAASQEEPGPRKSWPEACRGGVAVLDLLCGPGQVANFFESKQIPHLST